MNHRGIEMLGPDTGRNRCTVLEVRAKAYFFRPSLFVGYRTDTQKSFVFLLKI